MLLCVLSEVTRWRLWFLSWSWVWLCTISDDVPQTVRWFLIRNFKGKWLILEGKCVSSLLVCHHVGMVWYGQSWFVFAIITCLLGRHMIANATHLVDYSKVHQACYFSSKWWLYWNLPWRTQGQRPESQALYAHAKRTTSLLLQCFTAGSDHAAVPKFSLFSSTIHSSASRSRLCRQNSLTFTQGI